MKSKCGVGGGVSSTRDDGGEIGVLGGVSGNTGVLGGVSGNTGEGSALGDMSDSSTSILVFICANACDKHVSWM